MKNLETLPTFGEARALHVVVETPRGSTSKLAYDADLGVVRLSRPLPHGLAYPHDWGFIPSTLAADGDPLDAMVVWDGAGYPGIVMLCRPIGILQVEQTNTESGKRERNDRLAVLPVDAPRWATVHSIFDLGERVREELAYFFRAAVVFEKKDLEVLGWAGPKEAMALVEEAAITNRSRSPRGRRPKGR
jgi:inorganic pyrophosphatase